MPLGDGTGYLLIHHNITDYLSEKTVADSPAESLDQVTVLSDDTSRVLTYEIAPEETALEAMIAALAAIPELDIYNKSSVFNDRFDIETLTQFLESSTEGRVSFRIWDHRVAVSSEAITIYNYEDTK